MINVAAEVFTEAPSANTIGNNVPIVPVKVVFIADRKVGSGLVKNNPLAQRHQTPCKPLPATLSKWVNFSSPTVH